MCGIVGVWGDRATKEEEVRDAVSRIRHRGPDGVGSFVDPAAGIALGHARLAILDLSDQGSQPMHSPSGRFCVVYNGEIYNHWDLRRELEASGARFAGTSDTETLVSAIDHWGLEATVRRLKGMFAIAVWDSRDRRVFLARDRFGLKPLYVGRLGGRLIFTSDLAALRAFGSLPNVSTQALRQYFRFACVPHEECIFEGFRKVAPGTLECFQGFEDEPKIERYWSVPCVQSETPDFEEATARVGELLDLAVERRLLSDVPVGVFLSGGIDSSLVAATMRQFGDVRSFSLGMDVGEYDESAYAADVAKKIGARHTTYRVSPQDLLSTVGELPDVYSEPFADSSQIPTLIVSRLARQEVTVVLTGDGGDEVFGGYNRHIWGPRLWRLIRTVPAGIRRRLLGRALRAMTPALTGWVGSRFILPLEKLDKVERSLAARTPGELYQVLTSCWMDPPVMGAGHELAEDISAKDMSLAFMNADLRGYLQHDILAKVDRASMAVGLEGRVPFLDHDLVEYTRRIPSELHFLGGKTKAILRELLAARVPGVNFDRPKAGFGLPIDTWLRGELRPWAEDLLLSVKAHPILDEAAILSAWSDFQNGRPRHHELWSVLMFLQWLDRYEVSVST